VSKKILKTALSATDYRLPFSSFSDSSGKKSIKGIIQGGNLAMCAWSLGSSFEVQLKKRIVFFEDIGTNDATAYSRIVQLKESGSLQPKAIIFGYLMKVKKMNAFIKAVQELFPKVPIIYNLPIGHQLPNVTIPIGAETTIDFVRKEILFEFPKEAQEYKVIFNA
ncbi:MAG: hypothetical protein KC535_06205, partial [Nanoarchaeota archaeon]|nr:hypothetical protein [Nanoarchaeota archaeon]